IGNNAVIGESAFHNASSLESVTLGEGAKLGDKAFYNNSSLKEIDLSKVTEIGNYALSGDVYYICFDMGLSEPAYTADGIYKNSFHGALVTSIDLSSAESIGEYSFATLKELTDVTLGEKITEIPSHAFAQCDNIKNINLQGIATIGEYAFMESGLESIDLSGAKKIDKYAFANNTLLADIKFGDGKKAEICEGAFVYNEALATVEGMEFVQSVGDCAFAYTALAGADLSGATEIGKNAFLKTELSEFTVKLGKNLNKLGDNPFAMCKVAPFSTTDTVRENGKEKEVTLYDFELSRNVFVVDGSLYYKNGDCTELITFAGNETEDVTVADGTDRISAYAFAGSDVKMVKFPYTTVSIGHKAFYDCQNLEIVVFNSYTAPILEEEYDPAYYNTLENIPGGGDYDTYLDFDGVTEVEIVPLEIIPYYMWTATGMYSNAFYGANFVDYVGHLEEKLLMVHPVNGVSYDSFVCQQYFDLALDGPAAPDESAVAAIDAINAIPKSLTWEDRHIVEAARKAYDAIATIQQKALVTNYNDLITAEQRIAALAPKTEAKADNKLTAKQIITIIAIVAAILVAGALVAAICFYNRYKEVINASVKAEMAVRGEIKANAKEAAKAKKAEARLQKKAEKAAKKADKKAKKELNAANKAEKDAKKADKAEKKNNKKKDGGKDEAEN
ncbi:MAG: leucine-rich repeat protein, partial [Clostridia bacterium]|nr:leucine-rich repeat protein [Clostridia bacterium]